MNYHIVFTADELGNKVHAIKGLRKLTGLGLKEAKDAIEELASGEAGPARTFEGVCPDSTEAREGTAMLEMECFKVTVLDDAKQVRHLLQQAATLSIEIGRHEAARDILQVLVDLQY